MRYFRLFALMGLLFLGIVRGAPMAMAQNDPSVDVGRKPFGSYQQGDIDSVSLLNQALTLDIPLFSYPQKGNLSLAFDLHYQSGPAFFDSLSCSSTSTVACIWDTGGTPTFDHGFNINFKGVPLVSPPMQKSP
jgi:hypothetical protein